MTTETKKITLKDLKAKYIKLVAATQKVTRDNSVTGQPELIPPQELSLPSSKASAVRNYLKAEGLSHLLRFDLTCKESWEHIIDELEYEANHFNIFYKGINPQNWGNPSIEQVKAHLFEGLGNFESCTWLHQSQQMDPDPDYYQVSREYLEFSYHQRIFEQDPDIYPNAQVYYKYQLLNYIVELAECDRNKDLRSDKALPINYYVKNHLLRASYRSKTIDQLIAHSQKSLDDIKRSAEQSIKNSLHELDSDFLW